MALIKCKECGKEISSKAKSCPNCGCPIEEDVSFSAQETKEKLVENDNKIVENQNPKENSSGGCFVFIIAMFFIIGLTWFSVSDGLGDLDSEPENIETEEVAEESTTEISLDDFKKQAEKVTYKDIYRNPETYKDKPIKIKLYVNEYDTQYLGLMDVYYCKSKEKDVFVTDYRETKEPTIAKGDTVIVYGRGAGTATLTEKEKNALGITKDSEKTLIPSINMIYVELEK